MSAAAQTWRVRTVSVPHVPAGQVARATELSDCRQGTKAGGAGLDSGVGSG